ncbi:aldo/keto reductase [Hyaloraphidium curvatum]|nr:aldo/keto reductase [Hyaloraphidium curvatum]
MGLSEFYAPDLSQEDQFIDLLGKCSQYGVTFIDTADMYGSGANEELIAKAIKKFGRDKFFISTKFGIVRDFEKRSGARLGIRGDPEYVRQACEASLKRLGVEQIDLYTQHRVDPKTPIEETVKAMKKLQDEGKVKYLGLSEASVETIKRAHAVAPISALQSEYSLWATDTEPQIKLCEDLGITFVAYSPLGRGFLSGEITKPSDLKDGDFRKFLPRFSGDSFAKNIDLVNKVKEVAKRKGCTPSQLALAWCIARSPKTILPIPGTTKLTRLEENIGLFNVHLSQAEWKELADVMKGVEGLRYPDMSAVNL